MIDTNTTKPQRIAKVIANAGICSRREAERLIEQGLVIVNGKKLSSPAITVTPEDKITVNGKPLAMQTQEQRQTRIFKLNKPVGIICSNAKQDDRPTIFEMLPDNLPRLISIGRLDINSEGLLLLTNDGELAQKMMHPNTGLERSYRVRVFGELSDNKLKYMHQGPKIDGVKYRPMTVEIERGSPSNNATNIWLNVTLTEGKNREIRRVMEHFNLRVNRLKRLSYGPFKLGDLPTGGIEEVPFNPVQKFLKNIT